MNYVLSLDVVKRKSMDILASSDGEVLIEPYEFKHNETDFNSINSKITKVANKERITVIMEATGIYHKSPERFKKKKK